MLVQVTKIELKYEITTHQNQMRINQIQTLNDNHCLPAHSRLELKMKSESFLSSHTSNQGRKWKFPHTDKLAHIEGYAQDHKGDKRIRNNRTGGTGRV